MSDLIVLGSGAAGLTGALVAAVGGARVTVLEKADLIGGTTAMSGGGAWLPNNRHVADVGVEDSHDEVLTYLRAVSAGTGDDELLRSLVEHAPEVVEFLEDEASIPFQIWPAVGSCIDYRPSLPGAKHGGRTVEVLGISLSELGEWADRIRTAPELRSSENLLTYYTEFHHLRRPPTEPPRPEPADVDLYWRGTALVARLLKGCLDRGVELHTSTRATGLLVDNGRITGVKAEHDDEEVEFCAPHVLVATGGFTHNQELKRLWLAQPLDYTCDVSTNEGDGHLMGDGRRRASRRTRGCLVERSDAHRRGWHRCECSRHPRGSRVATHADGERLRQAVHERGGQLLRLRRSIRSYSGIRASQFPRVAAVRSTGSGTLRRAQLQVATARRSGTMVPLGRIPRGARPFDRRGLDDLPSDASSASTASPAAGSTRIFIEVKTPGTEPWSDPDNTPNPSLGTLERPPFFAMPMWPGAASTRGGLRIDATGRVLSA